MVRAGSVMENRMTEEGLREACEAQALKLTRIRLTAKAFDAGIMDAANRDAQHEVQDMALALAELILRECES